MANKVETLGLSSLRIETIRPNQGIWRTYDITDGLPAGVSRMLQDRKGYIWFLGSPWSGELFRYDGMDWNSRGTVPL